MNDLNDIKDKALRVEYDIENRKSITIGVDMYLGEFVDKLVDDEFEYDELCDRIRRVIFDYADECVDISWNHLFNALRKEYGVGKEK